MFLSTMVFTGFHHFTLKKTRHTPHSGIPEAYSCGSSCSDSHGERSWNSFDLNIRMFTNATSPIDPGVAAVPGSDSRRSPAT